MPIKIVGRKVVKLSSAGIVAASLMSACGTQKKPQNYASLKITNGVNVSEDEFPSVVLLVVEKNGKREICSGTFVNDHQLVTAAHCVVDAVTGNLARVFYATPAYSYDENEPQLRFVAQALNIRVHPGFQRSQSLEPSTNDLAVIDFPYGIAPSYSTIGYDAPEIDDAITIVGFGNNQSYLDEQGYQAGEGSGVKRAGRNVVTERDGGLISFKGLGTESSDFNQGDWSATGSGDSGGPMFLNGTLVGVTSRGELNEVKGGEYLAVSYFVDLTNEDNRRFLDEAMN